MTLFNVLDKIEYRNLKSVGSFIEIFTLWKTALSNLRIVQVKKYLNRKNCG